MAKGEEDGDEDGDEDGEEDEAELVTRHFYRVATPSDPCSAARGFRDFPTPSTVIFLRPTQPSPQIARNKPKQAAQRPRPERGIVNRFIASLVVAGFAVVVGAMAFAAGMISFSGPSFPEFTEIDVSLTVPTEARIVAVEPISLDCRARVFAEVPVEGKREHEAFGLVYRTDRISMHAYGDVDTCVDGSAARITHNRDGSTDVVIPGDSIRFVRPRVDAVRTADSVDVDKDLVGKMVDAFPWVDDNLGLTPKAYAYAQNVIGSSECMRTAYGVTQDILIDAYHDQAVAQGADPDRLSVAIEGEPNFDDPSELELGDYELWVGDGSVACVASEDLGGISTPSDM